MGCGVTKEKIELDMLMLQLRRAEIKDQRVEALSIYKKKTGRTLRRPRIPDYIDHKAMKSIKQSKKLQMLQTEASEMSLKVNCSTKASKLAEKGVYHLPIHTKESEEVLEISEIPSLIQIHS